MATETPAGTTAVSSGTTVDTTPTPIELNDDSFVTIKGLDKPVKFGDHYRGLQGNFTKTAQKAAKLEQELKEAKQRNTEFEDRISRFQQPQNQNQPAQEEDLAAQFEQLPYMNGQDAAKLAKAVMAKLQTTNQGLAVRDKILMALAQKLDTLQKGYGTLSERDTQSQFNGKITKVLDDLGYGPEFKDIAEEIYLAYEGDDLDTEFPSLFKNRIEQLNKAFQARSKAKIDSARSKGFSFPTKGGNGNANGKVNNANKSAKQMADELWDSIQGSGSDSD